MLRRWLLFTARPRTLFSFPSVVLRDLSIFTSPTVALYRPLNGLSSNLQAVRHYAWQAAPQTYRAPRVRRLRIVGPVLFFAIASSTAFTFAAYTENSRLAHNRRWIRSTYRAQKHRIEAAIQRQADIIERWRLPADIARLWVMLVQGLESFSPAERIVVAIMATNAIVFLAWQVPRLGPFMARRFLDDPVRGDGMTLLTSVFSHRDVLHFGLNMAGLWSIGTFTCGIMGLEQFLAFYLSAGIGANLVSRLWRIGGVATGLAGKKTLALGLGASGALYGCLAFCAHQRPDLRVYVIGLDFLPPVRLGQAFPALMVIDMLGILRGWSVLGHHAHLGGTILGLAYAEYGQTWIWRPLQEFVRKRSVNN